MNPDNFAATMSMRFADRAAADGPSDAKLLDDIATYVRRFVVLSSAQADAIALFVLHTHTIEAADATPFIAITSAEMRSGKTRLLEVLDLLVRRPWRAITPSDAVLFRKVDAEAPTLLLDEVDAIFGPKAKEQEGLRALLNAGNRRGVTVDRCLPVGRTVELVKFSVFCSRALAGIGKLPATVADRSIPIRLKRRAKSEQVERFRFRDVAPEAEALRRRIETWAVRTVDVLREARPQVPDALDDRQTDGAEPLLAIADVAGGEWPDRSRSALVELCTSQAAADESAGIRLLRDVQAIFEVHRVARLHSADLCENLAELEEAPWGDYQGKPIKPRTLARLLEPYGVRSSQVKIDGRNRHGYTLKGFSDAWGRYISAPTLSQGPSGTLPTLPAASAATSPAILEMLPDRPGSVSGTEESSITTWSVAEVAFAGPSGERGDRETPPEELPVSEGRHPDRSRELAAAVRPVKPSLGSKPDDDHDHHDDLNRPTSRHHCETCWARDAHRTNWRVSPEGTVVCLTCHPNPAAADWRPA
jgi:hypothetical protein